MSNCRIRNDATTFLQKTFNELKNSLQDIYITLQSEKPRDDTGIDFSVELFYMEETSFQKRFGNSSKTKIGYTGISKEAQRSEGWKSHYSAVFCVWKIFLSILVTSHLYQTVLDVQENMVDYSTPSMNLFGNPNRRIIHTENFTDLIHQNNFIQSCGNHYTRKDVTLVALTVLWAVSLSHIKYGVFWSNVKDKTSEKML